MRYHDTMTDDLHNAAEWLVYQFGYPTDMGCTRRPPEALRQAIIDVIHEDKGHWLHGNELDRDEVDDWIADDNGWGEAKPITYKLGDQ